MRPVLSLVLLLTVAWVVRAVAPAWHPLTDPHSMQTALSVGLLLLGAWLSGRLIECIHQPKVTGYMVFGALVGPSLLALVDTEQLGSITAAAGRHGTPPLQIVTDMAVALIALTAGGEIHLPALKGRIRKLLIILLVHVAVLLVAVMLLVVLARPVLPFLDGVDRPTLIIVALLVAVVTIAKSPAVTVAMITDYRASGPMSQSTLVITVFKDLLLIVLFAAVMAVSTGMLEERTTVSPAFLFAVGAELIGSIAFGALLGAGMALCVGRLEGHLLIFVVGACLFMAVLGEQHMAVAGRTLHPEPLLIALSAGLVMRNAWSREAVEPLFKAVEQMALPVFCLFFAIAGARIELHVFAALWPFSLGLVAVRLLFTWVGVQLGLAITGLRSPSMNLMWLGFVSQAGVSLVLVTLIAKAFARTDHAGWAEPLSYVLYGAIFVNQLIGPLGFRFALLRSGEGTAAPPLAPRRDLSRFTGAAPA